MRRHIILLLISLIPAIALSQSWEILYEEADIISLTGGCANENGNYIFGSCYKGLTDYYTSAYAIFVDNDGDYNYASFPIESGQSSFVSAVSLDDGNSFVAGRKNSRETGFYYDSIWVAIINQNLEIVEEHTYPLQAPYVAVDYIRLTLGNHDDVVMAASAFRFGELHNETDCLTCRFDRHGNMLDCKYTEIPGFANSANPHDVSMMPGTENVMIMDSGFDAFGAQCISYMNENFDFFSHHTVLDERFRAYWVNSSVWLDNDHFLMAAMMYDVQSEDLKQIAAVFKCDTTLALLDTLIYNRYDTADYTPSFRAMEYINDSTLFFATYNETYFNKSTNSSNNDAVICLIDKDLNLLGTKRMNFDGDKCNRIYHIQKTNDGGCLFYGNCEADSKHMVYIIKLIRDDIIVPCSITEIDKDVKGHDAFPNPANDLLNIIIQNIENQSVIVSVIDAKGMRMFERTMSLSGDSIIRLDVSSFENGVYFYNVTNGENSFNGKFIKE